MVRAVKEVGPQRFREIFGRYYEDFVVGDTYEQRSGRTITEDDNHIFTMMTMNTHPMDFDAKVLHYQRV
jgi:itaconyl-CoA hydratase